MRKVSKVLGVLAVIIVLFASFAVADAKDLTVKFGTTITLDDFGGKGALLMKEVVEGQSQGTIKMNIFPAMQLGNLREHWEGCQAGVIDMVQVISSALEPFVPEVAILGMPFLFPNDFDEMWNIMDNTVHPLLSKHMEKKGFVLLAITSYGYAQMTTSNHQIKSLKDLEGVKMRTVPSPLLIYQYETWKASPTPIEFSELYIALQQGIADGQENGLSIVDTKKLYEVQKYLTVTDHYPSMGLIAASKIFWDRLSKEQKDIILAGVKDNLAFQRKLMVQERKRLLALMQEKGLEVYTITDEAREEWAKASTSIHDKYASISPNNEKMLKAVYSALGK